MTTHEGSGNGRAEGARGQRWFLAGVILVLGLIQAVDSDVRAASTLVSALVLLAILVPAAALALSQSRRLYLGAVIATVVLLSAARVLSPTPLPGLYLIAVFPSAALLVHVMSRRLRREGDE